MNFFFNKQVFYSQEIGGVVDPRPGEGTVVFDPVDDVDDLHGNGNGEQVNNSEKTGFVPHTREEHLISKLAGNPNAKDIEPKTRWEYFIHQILGTQSAMFVKPKSREEYMLKQFAKEPVGPTVVYGFRIDSTERDPSDCITYLESAVGMEPAAMDFANDTWSYGGWENAFFMPKPCMLKYDGTVDYYLDPNDYSKKADGSASDIADVTYGGNAMMEWGRDGQKIWYKIVPDESDNTSANVYFSNAQVDEDYHAWPFINNQGDIVDHFYTPIYNGTIDGNGKLRSISGITYQNYCKEKTAAQEIVAAEANNTGAERLWYTETFADVTLIQLLTVLVTKSLDAQGKIGVGACEIDMASEASMLTTGSMNDKGLFWGGDHTVGVKCFGMENFWGNQFRRFAGLVYDGEYKYKLTAGTEDGSSASDYNTTGEGYIGSGFGEGGFGGFIDKQAFNSDALFMSVPYEPEDEGEFTGSYCSSGFADTGKSGVSYAFRGSSVNGDSANCGLFALVLAGGAAYSFWDVGAAPSCKPLSLRGGSGGDSSHPVKEHAEENAK